MVTIEDKGKTQSFDKGDMNGLKPFGTIGPDRDVNRDPQALSNIKSKLNKNHKKKVSGHVADGSTTQSGEDANVASKALSGFASRKK